MQATSPKPLHTKSPPPLTQIHTHSHEGTQQTSNESQDISKTFLGLLTKLFSTEKVSEFKNQDLKKMLAHLKTQYPKILTALNEILNSITEIDDSKKIPTEITKLTKEQLAEAINYAKDNGLD